MEMQTEMKMEVNYTDFANECKYLLDQINNYGKFGPSDKLDQLLSMENRLCNNYPKFWEQFKKENF